MDKPEIIEKFIMALGGGIGGMILTLFAFWKRLLTRKEHDDSCIVGELAMDAVTKRELAEALGQSAKETDLKLSAIGDSIEKVDVKVDTVKRDLTDAIHQSKKDLSGKLGIAIALLMGKPPPNEVE